MQSGLQGLSTLTGSLLEQGRRCGQNNSQALCPGSVPPHSDSLEAKSARASTDVVPSSFLRELKKCHQLWPWTGSQCVGLATGPSLVVSEGPIPKGRGKTEPSKEVPTKREGASAGLLL